ncbi:MAG: hypothetical protein LBU40_03900 [Methanobrevibacter sp.]|jgi:hypothetical protein|nr:hypothetical protein [Methanobrevibacter sp.]
MFLKIIVTKDDLGDYLKNLPSEIDVAFKNISPTISSIIERNTHPYVPVRTVNLRGSFSSLTEFNTGKSIIFSWSYSGLGSTTIGSGNKLHSLEYGKIRKANTGDGSYDYADLQNRRADFKHKIGTHRFIEKGLESSINTIFKLIEATLLTHGGA